MTKISYYDGRFDSPESFFIHDISYASQHYDNINRHYHMQNTIYNTLKPYMSDIKLQYLLFIMFHEMDYFFNNKLINMPEIDIIKYINNSYSDQTLAIHEIDEKYPPFIRNEYLVTTNILIDEFESLMDLGIDIIPYSKYKNDYDLYYNVEGLYEKAGELIKELFAKYNIYDLLMSSWIK